MLTTSTRPKAETLQELREVRDELLRRVSSYSKLKLLTARELSQVKIVLKQGAPSRLNRSPHGFDRAAARFIETAKRLSAHYSRRLRGLESPEDAEELLVGAVSEAAEPTGQELVAEAVESGRQHRVRDLVDRLHIARLQVEKGLSSTEALRVAGLEGKRTPRWARAQRQRFEQSGMREAAMEDMRRYNGRSRGVMSEELRRVVMTIQRDRPAAGPRAIWRKLEEYCNQEGKQVPSESAVKEVLYSLPAHHLACLRGERDLVRRSLTQVVRMNRAEFGSHLWQMDHKELDVWVSMEVGGEMVPVAVWITVAIDEYSRAVMGYHLTVGAPDVESSGLALLHACNTKGDPQWFGGLPRILQVDMGPDFTSEAMETVCKAVGTELSINPGHYPNLNGVIERFLLSLKSHLINLPGNRDAFCRSEAAAQRQVDRLWALPELRTVVDAWIRKYNVAVEHGETHEIPMARWLSNNSAVPVEDDAILRLLYVRTTPPRLVQNDGVSLPPENGGLRYQHPKLAVYIKKPVNVHFSHDEPDHVLVYCASTREFICVAWAEGTAGYPDVADVKRERAGLAKHIKQVVEPHLEKVKEFDRPKVAKAMEAACEPSPDSEVVDLDLEASVAEVLKRLEASP